MSTCHFRVIVSAQLWIGEILTYLIQCYDTHTHTQGGCAVDGTSLRRTIGNAAGLDGLAW